MYPMPLQQSELLTLCHLMCSSAAGAPLPYGLTLLCIQTMHTCFITSDSLLSCLLEAVCHSPLIFDIIKALSPGELLPTGYFRIGPLSLNFSCGFFCKSPVDQQFLNYL